MRKILLFGAGKSSAYLIKYLLNNAEKEKWEVIVVDINLEQAKKTFGKYASIKFVELNFKNKEKREQLIKNCNIVVSMLPHYLHKHVALECIHYKKNMITASYISNEMEAINKEVKDAGILIMNEIGFDPGIDHISAMKELDEIKEKGGKITHFESYAGGLIAKESDNNPWHYKFTWNPKNVIFAGKGEVAKYLEEGKYKYAPYHQLFKKTRDININNYAKLEGYPNRDSLKYRKIYKLENIETMIRGTLRHKGFCEAWDTFIKLGIIDDSFVLENSAQMSYKEYINTFLDYETKQSVENKLIKFIGIKKDGEIIKKLKWLELFSENKIGIENATPAEILQNLLEKKWKLEKNDKDMAILVHKFKYTLNNSKKQFQISMLIKGEDDTFTAMAKTVGLPLAICTKLVLNNKYNKKGVRIPVDKEIYSSILKELETYNIYFNKE